MGDARNAALTALEKFRRAGAWSDAVLGSIMQRDRLDARDKGLATALCYGVLQNMSLLDWHIDRHSSVKTAKLEPKVLDILRLSACQIIFMDRIPASAAVNEGVKLCKKLGFSRASGLVNAVLRRLADEKPDFPQPEDISIKYSHSEWLRDYLTGLIGREETEEYFRCDNAPVPLTLQVNTLKTDCDALTEQLLSRGIAVRAHPFLPDCLLADTMSELGDIPEFKQGLFYIQDAAAKMAVKAAEPENAERILDACSAPGGKSFAAAILGGGKVEISSCDIHKNKLTRIVEGAERLGISTISTFVADGRVFNPEWSETFDLVIADVPCSGLGVIRKKPDIRYKDPQGFDALPKIQLDILGNLSKYVRPGGILLYSTCTVRTEENSAVVSAFLNADGQFKPEDFITAGGFESREGMLQLWPQRHGTDGFFISKLRRN